MASLKLKLVALFMLVASVSGTAIKPCNKPIDCLDITCEDPNRLPICLNHICYCDYLPVFAANANANADANTDKPKVCVFTSDCKSSCPCPNYACLANGKCVCAC
ncbi:hypothetical protein ABFS82_12G086200 [Erythranthe guttata]